MHCYYLVDYLPDQPVAGGHQWSYTLPIPEGVGFRRLAGPGFDPPWAVFACERALPRSAHVRRLSRDLYTALRGTEHYPPALAVATGVLALEYRWEPPTKRAFSARYAALLREELARQPAAGYRLAAAVGAARRYHPVGPEPGRFHWVLGYAPEGERVWYVDARGRVSHAPADDFALTAAERTALPTPVPLDAPVRAPSEARRGGGEVYHSHVWRFVR